jgi:hypothetical protein
LVYNYFAVDIYLTLFCYFQSHNLDIAGIISISIFNSNKRNVATPTTTTATLPRSPHTFEVCIHWGGDAGFAGSGKPFPSPHQHSKEEKKKEFPLGGDNDDGNDPSDPACRPLFPSPQVCVNNVCFGFGVLYCL